MRNLKTSVKQKRNKNNNNQKKNTLQPSFVYLPWDSFRTESALARRARSPGDGATTVCSCTLSDKAHTCRRPLDNGARSRDDRRACGRERTSKNMNIKHASPGLNQKPPSLARAKCRQHRTCRSLRNQKLVKTMNPATKAAEHKRLKGTCV